MITEGLPGAGASAVLRSDARAALVRRGQQLSRLSLAYNSLEAIVSLIVGAMAGSISLIGFGADSVIEVSSSVAALWRLRADADFVRRARVEAITLRLIGLSFLGLTLYILIDAGHALYLREAPEKTVPGIFIAAASVVIMPLLARAKRRVGIRLGSRALTADAMQTSLCTWLSAIVLLGVGLNALLGWWWADPMAALCMTPIIAKEGIEGLRGEEHCDDCG
ncbi:MAG TPA: cation transporter [Gemmatimonadaceae bacterium]|nr:cation transporter [Gemmatimonadaceae bacterium]